MRGGLGRLEHAGTNESAPGAFARGCILLGRALLMGTGWKSGNYKLTAPLKLLDMKELRGCSE